MQLTLVTLGYIVHVLYFLPVLYAHNYMYLIMLNLVGKISLEFTDALQPVASRLLTDQLNVEEGALAWAVGVARGGPPHNAGRHIGHKVL